MAYIRVFKSLFLPMTRNSYFSTTPRVFLLNNGWAMKSVFQNKSVFTHVRKYCANHNVPNVDPNQEKRRRGLTILTYLSGFIGACLLTAVGARQYQKLKYRARGIEPVKNRLYGRRPKFFYYRGCTLPYFTLNIIDNIHTFKVKEDDIWIVSFPKAGTTWLQEIVYLVDHGADLDSVKSTIEERFPYFEFIYPGLKAIDKMVSPRYIKTHLPISLLPNDFKKKKPKTIYLARNPKDTVVSLQYYMCKFLNVSETVQSLSLEDCSNLFLDGDVVYGPYHKHVKEGWEKRNDDNFLFITYEEMKEDLPGSIKKIAAFLGKSLSPQEVETITNHCSFDEMKKNNFVNYTWFHENGMAHKDASFMRNGKVGDWKKHLSQEIANKFDEMTATKLSPLGLTLKDSLDQEVQN